MRGAVDAPVTVAIPFLRAAVSTTTTFDCWMRCGQARHSYWLLARRLPSDQITVRNVAKHSFWTKMQQYSEPYFFKISRAFLSLTRKMNIVDANDVPLYAVYRRGIFSLTYDLKTPDGVSVSSIRRKLNSLPGVEPGLFSGRRSTARSGALLQSSAPSRLSRATGIAPSSRATGRPRDSGSSRKGPR